MRKALKILSMCCVLVLAIYPAIALQVKVTAYTNDQRCTDSTPNVTASGLQIKKNHYWGIIALSKDLARGHKFGDLFELKIGDKTYVVEYQDRMSARMRKTVDLLLPSIKDALRFGVKNGELKPIEKND